MDYDAEIKNLGTQLNNLEAELQQKTVLKFKIMGAMELLAALKQAEAKPTPTPDAPPALEVVK